MAKVFFTTSSYSYTGAVGAGGRSSFVVVLQTTKNSPPCLRPGGMIDQNTESIENSNTPPGHTTGRRRSADISLCACTWSAGQAASSQTNSGRGPRKYTFLVTAFKATLAKHAYAKYIIRQDQNFIFGARDLEKARNGNSKDQVEAVLWPMLPDGSTVPKQDQHSRDLRKLYKKYNPNSQNHRTDCAANNYAWLHAENIPQIVEAARHALKGKQLREFCAKKSLEKLCRVTSKPESFIQALNEALFAAKPIFVPVQLTVADLEKYL
eukprot:COSAG01_NODE_1307_length_10805_cov_22.707547_3_plen_266_part_00